MTQNICFYMHVHQPYRLAKFSVFDIGKEKSYFDNQKNRAYLERIVNKSYLPATNILLELVRKTDGKFRIGFSITGVVMEQLERDYPNVIENFRKLAKSGCEIVGESYYHSLASLHSNEEFENQVRMHEKNIKRVFGKKPVTLRNTELMFNNDISWLAQKMGYKTILAEGHEKLLGRMSPCFVYKARGSDTRILLRHYRLSDDVAFRFPHHYLPAERYAEWIISTPGNIVNLFMDFETFGEHHWEESGILKFLERFPQECLKNQTEFLTPAEASEKFEPITEIDVPHLTSWADTERDLSAWTGNKMQSEAVREVYGLEGIVKSTNDPRIMDDWRKLQTSDHFYFMCTKYFADGDVHKYFNPYDTPYEAFINFMNAITDLKQRAEKKLLANEGSAEEAKHLLRNMENDKAFFCSNGDVYRNVKDFMLGLKNMNDQTFNYHSNENKNDFASWVRHSVGDKILASTLEKTKDVREARKSAKKRVGYLARNYLLSSSSL